MSSFGGKADMARSCNVRARGDEMMITELRSSCRYPNAVKFSVAVSYDCCPLALLLSHGDGWLPLRMKLEWATMNPAPSSSQYHERDFVPEWPTPRPSPEWPMPRP